MTSNNIHERWVKFAQNDLSVAIREMNQTINPRLRPFEVIIYHCQQSAEKMLKAYIVSKGILPPKHHKLEDLRMICANFDNGFNSARLIQHCAFLNIFIAARYPDFTMSVDASNATRGINSAKRIHDFISKKLNLKDELYFK